MAASKCEHFIFVLLAGNEFKKFEFEINYQRLN